MAAVTFPEDKFYKNDIPFRKWLGDFEEYVLAAYGTVDNARKKAILKQMVGDELKKYIDTLEENVTGDYTVLTTHLKEKFQHKQNETIERHIFNNMTQNDGELIDSFVIRLRQQAAKCNYLIPSVTRTFPVPNQPDQNIDVPIQFTDITDDLIRDRVVCGILNQNVRTRLLRDKELTLESAISHVRAQELAEERNKALDGNPAQVDSVKDRKRKLKRSSLNKDSRENDRQNPQNSYSSKKVKTQKHDECGSCGYQHKPGHKNCPARGQTCNKCGGPNHFGKVCRSKRKVNVVSDRNETSESDSDVHSEDDYNELCLGSLTVGTVSMGSLAVEAICSRKFKSWRETAFLNNHPVRCKVDTGAECNVVSQSVLNEINPKMKLQQAKNTLNGYGGANIPILGSVTLSCKLNGIQSDELFFVVPMNSSTVIGLDLCIKHNLVNPKKKSISEIMEEIDTGCGNSQANSKCNESDTHIKSYVSKSTVDQLKVKYKDVFDTKKLGRMSEFESSIRLSQDAVPAVHAVRKIPFALKDSIEKELLRMESLGVIEKVDGPTEWVSSMVLVSKDAASIRICLDPTDLNKYVMREHTRLPTPEETFSSIGKASVFSKLDLKSGYWQLPLDERSSYLTTFNTPIGRYRYKVMPFGLNSANEIFQKRMVQAFEGCKGTKIMFDDILVFADSIEEHNKCLDALLKRCRDVGIKLNPEKCKFFLNEVTYIGHTISSEGIKPDHTKVNDIMNMPPPTDRKGVQRLLGMVTYLARYIPNLSTITKPIRQLLNKKNLFEWSFEQEKAFNEIKRLLTSEPVLAFYDVKKDVVLHCDASTVGLGVCLLQDNKPVAYGSRSLTPAEKNYATIEKELLAVLYALERFDQYVYGKHVLVYTDHKPLVPLQQRPIHATPPRIQRMLLRTQLYDFKLAYRPGKKQFVADALSRACVNNSSDTELELECEESMRLYINSIDCPEDSKMTIRSESATDPCLSKVFEYCREGWPESKQECDKNVLPYWQVRNELAIFDNMIIFNNRIVIPKSLQGSILNKIHAGHQGMVRCKALAKQSVYWCNINKDIENKVESCSKCLNTRKFPDKVVLKSHEVPSRPFEKIGVDILTVGGFKYQILVCYFSKWVEVTKFRAHPTSRCVIDHLKSVFCRFGFPDCLFSDRERIYKSKEVDDFCNEFNIQKKFSSSMYAQSNGQVERVIGHIKNLIKRCDHDLDQLKLSILDYHNTPIDSNIPSPFQILMNRPVKGRIPCLNSNLVTDSDRSIRKLLTDRQIKSSEYYNRTVSKKVEHVFKPGDLVVYRSNPADRVWKRAKVVDSQPHLRSYTLVNTLGNLIVRNSKMILPDKTGQSFAIVADDVGPLEKPSITDVKGHLLEPARSKPLPASSDPVPVVPSPVVCPPDQATTRSRDLPNIEPRRSSRIANKLAAEPRRSERLKAKS